MSQIFQMLRSRIKCNQYYNHFDRVFPYLNTINLLPNRPVSTGRLIPMKPLHILNNVFLSLSRYPPRLEGEFNSPFKPSYKNKMVLWNDGFLNNTDVAKIKDNYVLSSYSSSFYLLPQIFFSSSLRYFLRPLHSRFFFYFMFLLRGFVILFRLIFFFLLYFDLHLSPLTFLLSYFLYFHHHLLLLILHDPSSLLFSIMFLLLHIFSSSTVFIFAFNFFFRFFESPTLKIVCLKRCYRAPLQST